MVIGERRRSHGEYRIVLEAGVLYFETWRRKLEEAELGKTGGEHGSVWRRTESDHVNYDPTSFHVGDSKYWTTWPEGSSMGSLRPAAANFVEWRVRAAVDSIEKARLAQYTLIAQEFRVPGARAWNGHPGMVPQGMGLGSGRGSVWKDVFSREVTIITPVKVPEYVQNMIRSRVRGAGRNVTFQVIPARLDLWAGGLAD